jgi:hypothetical protein
MGYFVKNKFADIIRVNPRSDAVHISERGSDSMMD